MPILGFAEDRHFREANREVQRICDPPVGSGATPRFLLPIAFLSSPLLSQGDSVLLTAPFQKLLCANRSEIATQLLPQSRVER